MMKNESKTAKDRVEELSTENKHDILNRSKAREIVQEIMNFGVSQSQIIYIIRMLSLELEDVTLMNSISDLIMKNEKYRTWKIRIEK